MATSEPTRYYRDILAKGISKASSQVAKASKNEKITKKAWYQRPKDWQNGCKELDGNPNNKMDTIVTHEKKLKSHKTWSMSDKKPKVWPVM